MEGTGSERKSVEHRLDRKYAQTLDEKDALRSLRDEFRVPTKGELRKKSVSQDDATAEDSTPCTYLCGNSLGLQPKRTRSYIESYLDTWSQKGVYGHFKPLSDQKTLPWVDIDEQASEAMAKIVGAEASEVAVMQTLTANLHFLLASFYRPSKERHKIIIEGKAFPSDHVRLLSPSSS